VAAIEKVASDRRRRDGRRHRRSPRQRRRAGGAARHRARRGRRPQRARPGAIARMLKADPAPFMHAARAKARDPGQSRGRPRPARRLRLDRRGGGRAIDVKQRRLPEDRRRAQAGLDRLEQHLDDPAREARRGPAGELQQRLPHHPLLQPAALHAAARAGRRAADPARVAERSSASSATCGSARASSTARTRRASSPTASAPSGSQAATKAAPSGLTVEEADAVAGRPLGFPKTGVFGLLDLVGLDLMPHMSRSHAREPAARRRLSEIHEDRPLLQKMIAEGYTGRKGKGGFYRLNVARRRKRKQAIDLATGAYARRVKPRLASVEAARRGGLRALLEHPDAGGRFAWACCRRRSPTPPRWCRRSPTTSPRSTRRCARLQLEVGALRAPRPARTGVVRRRGSPPRAAGAAAARQGRRRHLLSGRGRRAAGSSRPGGAYDDVARARGRAAARRREARVAAGGEERLGQPLGPRRRRAASSSTPR
jgi:hypothetical protein